MDHIAHALRDVTVTEEITEATPFWAVLAIGFAGRLAADFGARVVRRCDRGDPLADQGRASARHLRALRAFLNAGKEADAGVQHADGGEFPGLHLSLRYGDPVGGTGASKGFAIRKDVIFTERDAARASGMRPASELTIAAESGLLDIVGRSDARPLMIGGHQISYSTGLSGFLAAVALVYADDLDRALVSALGTAMWINWKSLAAAAQGRPIPRRAAESGKWRTAACADGYVALVYFDRDWPTLSKMTEDADMAAMSAARAWGDPSGLSELERRLEAWALRRTRAEIAAASKGFGLALGPVWTPTELLADAQYRARDFIQEDGSKSVSPRLPVVVAARGEAPGEKKRRRGSHDRTGPLAGIRVIDLGILTAGASTSALLADLGADVIKVESPTYLDPFRGTPGTSRAEGWWNSSDAFKSTNRNKRGICLDLKSARGRELFLQLAEQSDVVIENFRRGVMQRLGIGYDALRAVNSGIILASVSSQGETGPDAGNISFGSTLEATSGLAALTAYDDGRPLVTGMDLNYPDQVGSVFAAATIIAALRPATSSGIGAHLDVSQRELATFLVGEEIIAGDDHDKNARFGNASPEHVLQDTFAARDGWVAVSLASTKQLTELVALVAPDLARTHDIDRKVCKHALLEWMAARPSGAICRALGERGIAVAPVVDGRGAWDYAQRVNDVAIQPLARSPSGEIAKGFPFNFPQKPIAVQCAAPDLGQHTEEVLQHIVGLHPSDIAKLAREGVIGKRPVSPDASRLD